ncbi:MAG: histidinol dehydrogenase, partial [Pseudomonadota bacterium]
MIQIKRFNSIDPDFNSNLEQLLAFENAQDDAVDLTVAKILADVRKRKDAALIEYTNRFDRLSIASGADLELTQHHLQQSLKTLPSIQRTALEQAVERIQNYHEKQQLSSWQYTDSDGT